MDMKRHLRHFGFLLLILALISAGISPACAFISGKTSLIEICTADGGIKTIAVTEDGRQTPIPDTADHKSKKADCIFCFNAGTAKSGPADSIIFYITSPPRSATAQSLPAIPSKFSPKFFYATGPPPSLLL